MYTISFPCAHHDECTFHRRYFPAALQDHVWIPRHQAALSAVSKQHEDASSASRSVYSVQVAGQSRLELLPRELLLLVLDSFTLADKACLALTSRSMACSIGSNVWSEVRQANRTRRNDFLRILVRDMREQFWHCEFCGVLHQRSREVVAPPVSSVKQHASPARRLLKTSRLFGQRRQSHAEEQKFQVRVHGVPIYVLSFPLVKSVTDWWITHKELGTCLHSLNCKGVRLYPHKSETARMILKYDFQPRIFENELSIRAAYTWEVENWRERLDIQEAGRSKAPDGRFKTIKSTGDIDLLLCQHMDAHSTLHAAFKERLSERMIRCQYCPTQMMVTQSNAFVMEYSIQFEVWHKLGPCQSPEERRWMHVVKGGREKKEFDWNE